MSIEKDPKPFSLTMLMMHRRQKREGIEGFIASSMYLRILSELVKSGQANRGEAWIYCDEEDQLEYEGIRVRLVSDFSSVRLGPVDVLFVRGDKKHYLPVLKQSFSKVKRMFFYGASGRGIPRYWPRFHGILIDDMDQMPVIKRYYPRSYIGEFMKTAIPENFHPLGKEDKEFDVCMVGVMGAYRKNFEGIAKVISALPAVRFVICGKGDPEMMQKLSGQPGQITTTGFISPQALNQVMNRSRMAVIPSNERDAAPRVILEYMASGLPILANSKMCGGKKFILAGAGRSAPLSEFTRLIPEILSDLDAFHAHEVFEENFSPGLAARDFSRHVYAMFQMADKLPSPSWRGRMARVLRSRLDNESNV